jgi:hypothetical protein
MRHTLPYAALALVAIAGCTADSNTLPAREKEKPKPGQAETASAAGAANRPGAPATPLPPLAEQAPTQDRPIRRANGLWRMKSAFAASAPTVTANERHSMPVTGTDCLSCHGAGGTAPTFAFAGTIALGKQWAHAPKGWRPNVPATAPRRDDDGYDDYDDYDDYGDYEDCYDDGYDGYDDYDSYDSYDDYGDEYGGRCGRKGWPAYRNDPSPRTEVRIVGSDGYVFETVTDADGNFWFKTTAEVREPAFTGVRYGEFRVAGASFGMACGSCHESGEKDNPGRIWSWDGPMPR